MRKNYEGVNESIHPSGDGCVECLSSANGWWLHLRRCTACGHVGCCDNSPSQHASAHFRKTGHSVITSFEPGEKWFYDFLTEKFFEGPRLADPQAHRADQPAPAPANRVPEDWQSRLNS